MRPELIGEDWYEFLKDEFEKPYFKELWKFLEDEYKTKVIRPNAANIFEAFKLCPLADLKVVIIGQDPYPNIHGHGLAFSSLQTTRPPSLRYIFSEIITDLNSKGDDPDVFPGPTDFPHNNLTGWANQGVLLLNTVLTCIDKQSNSHKGKGWEQFTQSVVRKLISTSNDRPIVFLLWGNHARKAFSDSCTGISLADQLKSNTIFYQAGHPAAACYGKDLFSGCKHFSRTNEYLISKNLTPITWTLS